VFIKPLQLIFYRWGMNYNFQASVLKYERDKNNPVITKHIEACNFYATKILKLAPKDDEANKRYNWTLEVLAKSTRTKG
jgi:hypothetical protein